MSGGYVYVNPRTERKATRAHQRAVAEVLEGERLVEERKRAWFIKRERRLRRRFDRKLRTARQRPKVGALAPWGGAVLQAKR